MEKKVKEELEEKVLYINRCSKVVKGGRKFSFSALVIVGDRNGKVGFGFAKANEVSDAIKKGSSLAKKSLLEVEMKNNTISHEVFVKQDGVKLLLRPAKEGTGVVAGSMVRAVLEFVGIKDVCGKIIGSNNPLNQVYAVFKALESFSKEKEKEVL